MYSPFLKKFEHFYPSNTFRRSRITISRLFGSQLESRLQGLVTIFPGSFARDGYHINVVKILDYEAELAAFMAAMVTSDTQQ